MSTSISVSQNSIMGERKPPAFPVQAHAFGRR
jgi:hypothetical protein